MGRRTGAGPIVDGKAEAVAELMLEVAQCFFRIRAVGQKTGLITSWGGGAFGFIRSLILAFRSTRFVGSLISPIKSPDRAVVSMTSLSITWRRCAQKSPIFGAWSEC